MTAALPANINTAHSGTVSTGNADTPSNTLKCPSVSTAIKCSIYTPRL